MLFIRLVIMFGLVFGVASFAWKLIPSKSKLIVTDKEKRFPIVSGYNLDRQQLEFPRDFGGIFNLVFLPFQQNQQTIVNTWIPFAQETERKVPGFKYYELPTIYEMSGVGRAFLNEGMRAGIPDQTARERTITLYLDKETFKSALEIPSEDDITILLVDQEGKILWRTTGAYNEEKANQLVAVLN